MGGWGETDAVYSPLRETTRLYPCWKPNRWVDLSNEMWYTAQECVRIIRRGLCFSISVPLSVKLNTYFFYLCISVFICG
jgi:hypothetical protein